MMAGMTSTPLEAVLSSVPVLTLPHVSAESLVTPQRVAVALSIVGTVLGAVLLRWVLHRAIGRVVNSALARAARHQSQAPRRASRVLAQASGLDETRRTQRAATMGAVLASTSTFVIFAMALLTVMATLGLQLAPLLASAGVAGVALGFGAQSLVKDFLSGIFMIFEDQYGVGDVVDAGSASGTVEAVGLRVTRSPTASTVPLATSRSTASPTPYWSSKIMKMPDRKSLTRLWAPKPIATPTMPALAISGPTG